MKICVCVKHVPDTAATIRIEGEAGFKDSEIKFVVNPYDEYGVEEAVKLVEKNGGEVVIVTVGKPEAEATIRSALAMGAERGILGIEYLGETAAYQPDEPGIGAGVQRPGHKTKRQSFPIGLCVFQ